MTDLFQVAIASFVALAILGTSAAIGGSIDPLGAPAAPTSFHVLARSGHINLNVLLNWTEPAGTVTMHSVRYVVGSSCAAWTTTKNITPVQTIVGAVNRQYLLGGLAAVTTYCFEVAAWNGTSESPWSSGVVATTLAAFGPACSNCSSQGGGAFGLAVTYEGANNATLVWQNPAGTIVNDTVYSGPNCSSLSTRAGTSGAATSWNLVGLSAGQWYCVRIGAWYSGSQGPLSNYAQIYLGAPYALAVKSQNTTGITVTWNVPLGRTVANDTLWIESGSCVGNWTIWKTAGGNKTIYNFTGLSGSTAYCIGVTAWTPGQTAFTALVSDTTGGAAGSTGGGGGGGSSTGGTIPQVPSPPPPVPPLSPGCIVPAWFELIGLAVAVLSIFLAIARGNVGWIAGVAIGGGLVAVGAMSCGWI